RIPGAGPYVIALTETLPPITDPVMIDGNTQPGFAGSPVIELSGANIQGIANGLDLQASNSLIRGLVIRNFSTVGINIAGNSNQVQNCFIGTDVTGTQAAPNGTNGITISDGTDNIIGGAVGNLISGNGGDGIGINGTGAQRNVVKGNKIGTDVNGTAALPNGGEGVLIYNGANNNTIGGVLGSTDENLIAGNTKNGVHLTNSGTLANVVVGNYIGTDLSGLQALGNGQNGVLIDDGASSSIGQTNTNGRYNIISGNALDGVHIEGTDTTSNFVSGNIIGLDHCGCNIVANGGDGVHIVDAPSNAVGGRASYGEGNLISGNTKAGVDIEGSGAVSNNVLGNFIGTGLDGIAPRGNTTNGVFINGASQTVVGGTTADDRNVISGNTQEGLYILDSSKTTVWGNYIGVDETGNGEPGSANLRGGITVNGSTDTTIGGTTAGARNVIAGNLGSGGPQYGDGIALLLGTTRTVIQGNYIGIDALGHYFGNAGDGIYVDGTSSNNIIGGSDASARNYISANGTMFTRGYGIDLVGTNNTVDFNYVGLDLNGNATPGFANVLGWLFDRGGNTIGQNNQHN
ncbi:MAG: hypothetical protein HYS12_26600, partial [Planctomycetes bacterium]|nr:hypothetical protein [Planctomycetota bacterium]